MGGGLDGLTVLVVEDEAITTLAIKGTLQAAGCRIAGVARRVGVAVEVLRTMPVDAATLDVNVDGELAYPLADVLAEQGTPFVFVTAH